MVEDTSAVEPASASGIETVPLDEEEIQRPRLGFPQALADRPGSFELGGWGMGVGASRSEVDGPTSLLKAHASSEVRQMEGKPCPQEGERVVGVQRKEPHPGTPSR